jgi:hypothetical protein
MDADAATRVALGSRLITGGRFRQLATAAGGAVGPAATSAPPQATNAAPRNNLRRETSCAWKTGRGMLAS